MTPHDVDNVQFSPDFVGEGEEGSYNSGIVATHRARCGISSFILAHYCLGFRPDPGQPLFPCYFELSILLCFGSRLSGVQRCLYHRQGDGAALCLTKRDSQMPQESMSQAERTPSDLARQR